MPILGKDKGKENIVQLTCVISDETERKIKAIRKGKGKRTRWIVRSAIEAYLRGEIEV